MWAYETSLLMNAGRRLRWFVEYFVICSSLCSMCLVFRSEAEQRLMHSSKMYLLRAGGKEAGNCKLVLVTLLNSPGIISQPIIKCSKQKLDHISVISKTPFFIS
jgi:hypothetical protein